MGATYKENPAGIAEMLRGPAMVDAMRHLAEKGKARFEEIAAVRTGHYKASAFVEAGVRDGVAYAEWGAEAYYSIFLEFGTRYMEAQRTLGRSIDALKE